MEVLGVGELARYLRESLRSDPILADAWVEGEIGTLARAASGHFYFTLRDEGAQLPCVMFRGAAAAAGVQPQSGMSVVVHGGVSFYEAGGKLELIVDLLYPAGLGLGRLQFEALRLKLEQEGLFAPERKRPLPAFPQRIGLITSDGGAVLHDILNVIGRRYALAEIVFAHSAVQGETAPRELVAAFDLLAWYHRNQAPLDAIILARGGGSAEDLTVFNDEGLARAIFRSVVPVVSAVGHEVDVTIADFVADCRAPTPSAAAELVTPNGDELREQVRQLQARAYLLLTQRLRGLRDQGQAMHVRLTAASPLNTVQTRRQDIVGMLRHGAATLSARLDLVGEQIEGRRRQLEALSPAQTLARGYAITTVPGRGIITSAGSLDSGDELQVVFHDGVADTEVRSVRLGEQQDARESDLRGALSSAPGDDRGA